MEVELTTPGVLLIGFVFFASVEVWRRLLTRRMRGIPLLPYEPRPPVPWTGLEVIGSVLIYFMAMQLVSLVMQIDRPDQVHGEVAVNSSIMLALSLGNLVAVAGSALLIVAVREANREDFGLPDGPEQTVHDLGIGLVGFLASLIPVFAIQFAATQLIPYEHPLIDMLRQPAADSRFWTIAVFSAVVAAPIAEEYFFRLVLQGWLERAFGSIKAVTTPVEPADSEAVGPEMAASESFELAGVEQSDSPYASPLAADATAPESNSEGVTADGDSSSSTVDALPVERWRRVGPIVVSSAGFAMMHLGQGPAPIPLFVLAFGLGYIYQRTHRILPCIALHALFNGYSLAMLALTR